MSEMKEWVGWFRKASPYINAHRNKVIVLAISGETLQHPNFDNIVHDIALLNSLGVRLVIVFGARPQIDEALKKNDIATLFHQSLRITDPEMMPFVLEAYGRLRSEIEAKLSMGVINSPMHGSKINVVSGNFVMARPHGVSGGVDLKLTGLVRSIDVATIEGHFENSAVVLVPAIGYSMSGDIFNLSYEALAAEVAEKLAAEKLVYFGHDSGLKNAQGELLQELTVAEAARYTDSKSGQQVNTHLDQEQINQLTAAAKACQAGVSRVHMLSYARDGALLEELFTRDGHGTMVSVDHYDQIRPARLEDANGILELIRPLEEQGFLVRRSRELLETELDYFLVDVRDNAIIGCAGLYPFPEDQAGELSCFAVDATYRRHGRGDRLLDAIEAKAKNQNLSKLFVLTTQTEHWFKERGFELASAQSLPGEKNYNTNRNAKVLMKKING